MKPAATMRFDFDPYGRAQTYLADWEREINDTSLRRKVKEAKARERHTGLFERFARRARPVGGNAINLGTAY